MPQMWPMMWEILSITEVSFLLLILTLMLKGVMQKKNIKMNFLKPNYKTNKW